MPTGTDLLFDASLPGEFIAVAIGLPSGVNDVVGDGLSVLEDVRIGLSPPVHADDAVGEFINVLESVTVSLTPLEAPPEVVVHDDVGATEAVVVQTPAVVVVEDDDVATDEVAVAFNPLLVDVSDEDVPTEAAEVDNGLAVYDTIAVEEAVDVRTALAVAVADDVSVADAVNLVPSIQISVFDDNTVPPLEPPPMPATGIARDYVEVTEGLGMGLGLPVQATDEDLKPDEVVAIGLGIAVRVSDDTSAADVIAADSVTINPVLLGFDTPVADPAAPLEAVIVSLALTMAVSDDDVPADGVAVAPVLAISVSDDSTPTDEVDARSGVGVRVGDDLSPAEMVDAFLSVLLLEVVDDAPNADLVGAGIPLGIAVEDIVDGGPDVAVGERRLVLFTDPEDLHFINDAGVVAGSTTGGRITRKH